MIKKIVVSILSLLLASLSLASTGIICRLSPNLGPTELALKYQISLVDVTAGAPFAYFSVANDVDGHNIEQLMVADGSVVWAEDDHGLSSPETEKGSTLPAVGDRFALYQQNKNVLKQIDFNLSLASSSGRAVRIAILDTGLSPLQGSLWSKVDASLNAIEPDLPAFDLPRGTDSNLDGIPDAMTGHGTMVAGLVDQISPQSRFVVARIANSDGYATAWTLIKGLAFAVTSGAEVANVSLGSLDNIVAMNDVLDWCEANQLLVVAAIGNNGINRACNPAANAKVICVSGLNPDNSKAIFSNYDSGCDVAAPATGIVSQFWDGGFANWSGTSFSTPMVAATVAESLRHMPARVSPAILRKIFEKYSVNIDSQNKLFKGNVGQLLDYVRYIQGLRNFKP